MANQVIGSLEIQMLANLARLSSDMAEAKKIVSDSIGDISKRVDGLKDAFFQLAGPLIGIASIGAFKSMVNDVVAAKVELQRLSIQTGASVESLSAIGAVAKMTGTNIADVASAMNKMQKAIATSNDDSKGAAQAIAAIGISFNDFAHMKADEQMLTVAKAMAGFEDGAGKTAVAMTLFGKSGAQLLPMLTELAEKNELVGKQTTASALEAKKYEEDLKRLDAAGNALKRGMVEELIPTLDKVVQTMLEFKKSSKETGEAIGEGLTIALQTVAVLGINLVYVFQQTGKELGGLMAQMARLAVLDFRGAATIGDAMKADAAAARKEVDRLSDSLMGLGKKNADAIAETRGWTPARPGIDASGIKGPLSNNAPKMSEGDRFLEQLERQLQLHEKDKFAMLELEAAQKGVTGAAQYYIDSLREIELREIRIKATVQEVTRNLEYEAAQRAKISSFVEGGNSQANSILREIETLGLDADAHRRLIEFRKIDDDLKAKNIGLTGEQVAANFRLAETLKRNVGQALDEVKKSQDALNGSWQFGAKQALDDYQKSIANVAESTRATMTKAFKGMEDALVNFVMTGKLDFKSLANSIISDMVRISIQQSIMAPFTAGFGNGGGILGGLKAVFGFANGGDPPVGVPSLVGERGPELFVPKQAGTIVPNGAMGGNTYNIAITQVVGDVPTLSAVKKMQAQTIEVIRSGIGRSQQYGGAMS